MRKLLGILMASAVATIRTHAGDANWFSDLRNKDNLAVSQARELVWDGVPHPVPASFEKTTIIDRALPYYLCHVVITSPGGSAEPDRKSYLVCFKLTDSTTEFRIVTVIQYASDPPTEQEIAIDKRLNRWPVSTPWKTGDDLPRNIKPPGLSIVLDEARAGSR